MKTKIIKIAWALVLIFLVGLTFACTQGYVAFDQFLGWKSLTIFTCLSILSLVSFSLSGGRKWAWLFPALLSAALALNAVGLFDRFGSPIVAFPILLSLAIPLYVAFYLDRKEWGWLVPAWILTVIALLPALIPLVGESLLIAMLLYSLSFPFMIGCLANPSRKGPQYFALFFALVGIAFLVDSLIHAGSLEPIVLLIIAMLIAGSLFIGAKVVTAIILRMRVSRLPSS